MTKYTAGNGKAYAPMGYRYTKQGDLKRIKQSRWQENELEAEA